MSAQLSTRNQKDSGAIVSGIGRNWYRGRATSFGTNSDQLWMETDYRVAIEDNVCGKSLRNNFL